MPKKITLEISDVLAGYLAGLSANARERGVFIDDVEAAHAVLAVGAISIALQGQVGADAVALCASKGGDYSEPVAEALRYPYGGESAASMPEYLRAHIRDSSVVLRDVVDANRDSIAAKHTGTA